MSTKIETDLKLVALGDTDSYNITMGGRMSVGHIRYSRRMGMWMLSFNEYSCGEFKTLKGAFLSACSIWEDMQ